MSIKTSLRAAAVLASVTGMFLIGMIVAQAQEGITGPSSAGPGGTWAGAHAAAARPAGAAPAALTTNTDPVATYVPSPQDATYVPLTPCRVIDTRPNIGRIPAGGQVPFKIRGNGNLSTQGGPAGGCGVPASAVAVTVSVSAVDIAGTGYFRIWPYGIADPGATIAHYQAGPISTTGGNVTLGAYGGAADVTAEAFQSGAGLVVDVTGYYEPQTHLIILADGTVWYGNATHVTAVSHSGGSGTYELTFDRSLNGCNVLADNNSDDTVQVSADWGGTGLQVDTWVLIGGSYVQQDASFQVFVDC